MLLAGSVLIARVDAGPQPAAPPKGADPAAHRRHRARRVSRHRAAGGAIVRADVLGLLALGPERTSVTERQRFRVSDRQQILLESGLPAGDDERLSHLAFETPDSAARVAV